MSGNTLTLAIENDGIADQTVDLSALDQDIDGLAFNNSTNVLTVGITDGTSQTVDLSDLDNSGTDTQTIDTFSLSGNTLTLAIENDGIADQTVDLSALDQDIDGLAFNNSTNVLTVGITDGTSQTVDLSDLDNSGTDTQTIDTFSLSGNTLTLAIENDGIADQTVDLSALDQDIDGLAFNNSTNVLTVGITDGTSQTVDLSDLDNSGTDTQTIDTFSLSGNTLTLAIENDGIADQTVDLSALDQDIDGLAFNNSTNVLTVGITDGTSQTVDLSDLDNSGTDTQTIDTFSLSGNTLTLAIENDGIADQTVDLSALDQDIDGLVFNNSTNVLTVGITGGTSQTVDLSDLDNSGTDTQTIDTFSLSGNTLTLAIENDGIADQTVDLSALDQDIDGLAFNNSTNVLTVGITDGTSQTVDLSDLDNSGTDTQTIDTFSLSGNTLTLAIENDGIADQTVDLSALDQDIDGLAFNNSTNVLTVGITDGTSQTVDLSDLDNSGTDTQTIDTFSLSGNTLTLAIENDGIADQTVDLSALDQDIDGLAFNNSTNVLTVGITDGTSQTVDLSDLDNSGTDTQTIDTFSLSGNTLTLAIENDGIADQTVDLSALDQDIDGLAFNNSTNVLTVGITGGTSQTVDLSDLDNSGTDSQTIAFGSSASSTQTTLEITDGNSLSLQASGSLSFSQTGTGTLELSVPQTDVTKIIDADGDTQVQVEEGSDDDTIRFDTDGEERMSISATEIQMGNDLSVISLALGQVPTGNNVDILASGGHEAFTESNASYPYANKTYGSGWGTSDTSVLFNGQQDGNLSLHIERNTSTEDWGFRYDYSTEYYINSFRLRAVVTNANNTNRVIPSEFRIYKANTEVYSSTITAVNSSTGWSAEVSTGGVIGDAIAVVFPNGQSSNYDAVLYMDDLEVKGQTLITQGTPGASWMLVDVSTQQVGIGTTTPSETLTVSGTTQITGALKDSSGDAGTSGQLLSSTSTGTNWVNAPESNTDSQTLTYGSSASSTQTTLEITDGNSLTLQASGSLSFSQTGTGTLELSVPETDVTKIVDADGDTQVQIEEGSDDDTIRFDTAGTEVMIMTVTDTTVKNDFDVSKYIALGATGSVNRIIPNFETFSESNATYINASLTDNLPSWGTTDSAPFFDGDTEGNFSVHIKRNAGVTGDWGYRYDFASNYYITNLQIQATTHGAFLRSSGGIFQVYRQGTLVYTSGVITVTNSSGAISTSVTPNVIGDRVEYVFRNGANSGHGDEYLGSSELIIDGQETTGDYDQSLFFVDISTENIGVGTNSPSEKLTVNGSAQITGVLKDSSGDAGTSGQILSSTSTGTNWIDYADSSTPTLAQVTSQGTITTDNIQVGGMTVSGTIGLTLGEGASQYSFPTTRGGVGQSLIVSTTASELVFSSPAYLLASYGGTTSIDMTKLSNSAPNEEIAGFEIEAANGIQITTTETTSDTIKLPAGKSFKLTAHIFFDSQNNAAVNYRFYDQSGTKYIGLEGSTVQNSTNYSIVAVPAVAYIEASTSSIEVRIAVISHDGSSPSDDVDTDLTRIEVEEIK